MLLKLTLLLDLLLIAISEGEKFQIKIYTESQCKDSIGLLQNSLKNLLDSGLLREFQKVVDLEIIPFGNGQFTPKGDGTYKFTCQHGDVECYGNMMEVCAMDMMPRLEKQLEFLLCLHVEKKKTKEEYDFDGERCLAEHPCMFQKVKQCMNSKEGNYLLARNAKLTKQSESFYVPWITVNGKHDYDNEFAIKDYGFFAWLCKLQRVKHDVLCPPAPALGE